MVLSCVPLIQWNAEEREAIAAVFGSVEEIAQTPVAVPRPSTNYQLVIVLIANTMKSSMGISYVWKIVLFTGTSEKKPGMQGIKRRARPL